MRLQEEYLKRHNLGFKPIYHVRKAHVILKLHSRPQVVVEIKWEETIRRPGYYKFDFFNPNHDGYLDGNYFLSLGDPHYYQYDEYDKFIMRWVRNLNFVPIKLSQVKLAAWQMFLYCFDGWIAEHDLEEKTFRVIDPSFSEEERSNEIDHFLDFLATYDTLVSDIYDSEFRKYENDYADWLAELIEFYSVVNGEA